jgi:hypothetical protein
MNNLARVMAVLAVCLFLGCSDDSGNGDGGAAGTTGAGGGTAGRGGSGGGAAGSGGSGGSGGSSVASCQTCFTCVMTNCTAALATCQANTGCNAIYQCSRMCTTDAITCATANPTGITMWYAAVMACSNQGCQAPCADLIPTN